LELLSDTWTDDKLKDKKFSEEKTSVHVSDNKKNLNQDI